MAMFQAFAPGVEVNGQTVFAVVDAMGDLRPLAVQILAAKGIHEPRPGEWYPQQAWLDAFREISERLGCASLWKIGLRIPENAEFPPEIDGLRKALESIDVAYHMNHRGGEIGHYRLESFGEREAVVRCENPYPCDFDRGIIEAMARRFAPAAESGAFRVMHDDAQPCRKAGAASCTYHVRW